MTTPAYAASVGQCIQDAFYSAGLLADGQRPSGEQYALALRRLNNVVDFQQTKGLKLFTNADIPVTLTLNVTAYQLGPAAVIGVVMTKPLRVIYGYYVDSNNDVIPMTGISHQEWNILQKNNQSGPPLNYYVDKQATALNVNIWPTPDATAITGKVYLTIQQQAGRGIALTDAISFPQEWYLGIMWALAYELAIGQPMEILQRCKVSRDEYLQALEGWDAEDVDTFFTVDPRMALGRSFS